MLLLRRPFQIPPVHVVETFPEIDGEATKLRTLFHNDTTGVNVVGTEWFKAKTRPFFVDQAFEVLLDVLQDDFN